MGSMRQLGAFTQTGEKMSPERVTRNWEGGPDTPIP